MNTLEKCVRILTLLSDVSTGMNISEISARLNIPLSTVYRYSSELKRHRLLEQDKNMGTYRLGTKILELASGVAKSGLRDIALPFMEQLSRKTGETVILSGLSGHNGICLEKVEGHHALRVSWERGAIFPLHAGASGKALMAHLSEAEQDEIIEQVDLTKFSETTITDRARLKRELRKIKAQGYGESDGEVIPGTYGIGAPILSLTGRIIAVLSVSAPTQRQENEEYQRMIQLVIKTAGEISKSCGRTLCNK
ncbi:MAG: IclR family transcriptional regulator [Candidatus Bipolaricaulota bacterium]|nr:IclR family transcriptional regulator [Candidatus Bipolaricaulota bacterium]